MTLSEANQYFGHQVTVDGCKFRHNAYLVEVNVSTDGIQSAIIAVQHPECVFRYGPYPLEHIRPAWQKPDAPE